MLFFVAGVNFSLEFLIERRYTDSWVTEFVDGFEVLSQVGKAVSIFGSSRLKPDNKYYKLAEKISYLVAREGYAIITGMAVPCNKAHYHTGQCVSRDVVHSVSSGVITLSFDARQDRKFQRIDICRGRQKQRIGA